MADSNALLASVPTIAGGEPRVSNPLAAINAGNEAASHMYDLRAKQAKEAAGQAYQGAINPQTGELDANEFRRRLAASGPSAMAAGESLLNIQTISSNQLEQQFKKAGWVNAAAGAALLQGDFSDGAMLRLFQSGVANGTLTMQDVQKQMQILPTDPEGRRKWLEEHRDTAASVAEQYEQQYGKRAAVSAGGTTEFPIVPSPRSGLPGPSVQHTATPGEQAGLVTIHVPVDAAGNPTTPDKAVRYDQKQVPRGSLPGLPMPAVPGAAPPAQTLPTNPNAPGARVVPVQPALQPKPAAGAPAAPAPTIPSAPPQGQPEELKVNQEAYRADQAAIPNVRTRAENAGHAYDALKVLKLNTGRGAEGISNIRSFLRTVGMLPPGTVKDTDVMDIFNKYTERAMIEAAGGGGTDLARQMATQASPGKTLGTGANLEIIRNDMGKTLQTMAANNTHDPTLKGSGYLEHRKNIALTTDPRGFVWNMYDEDEQKKIMASVKDDPVADSKLHRAIGMSLDPKLGLSVPVSRRPQKQSFLAPPMPAPNSFALAAPPPNALLMGGAGANA